MGDSFKWYESDTVFTEDKDNGYAAGKKKFSYVLQARKPGQLEIPSQKFTYFDTTLREYKKIYSLPLRLTVAAPSASQTIVSNSALTIEHENKQQLEEVEAFSEDIHYIEEDGPIFKRSHFSLAWYFFIFLCIAPLWGFYYGWHGLKKRIGSYGLKTPYQKACMDLKDIQIRDDSSRIYDVMRLFLVQTSGISQHQFGEESMRIFLHEKKWNEVDIESLMDFLNVCGGLSFASSKNSTTQTSTLVLQARKWIDRLEKGDV